jgi:hypothetical protein
MRRYLFLLLGMGALTVVTAVGIAGAAGSEGPVTVKVGPLELTSDLHFRPTVASKTKQTPIAIETWGEVKEEDGSRPPAPREIFIEADKSGEVHTKGMPTCPEGRLEATETKAALKACGPALIGEGTATVDVQFLEQKPLLVKSKLLLFNGGVKGNKTTWFAHAYFSDPISGAIVTTVTLTKIHHGRYGTLGVVKIPKIANGYGSGTFFELEIFKDVKVGGKTFNPISASCPDGKAKFHIEAKFEDGTRAHSELIRACTGRG